MADTNSIARIVGEYKSLHPLLRFLALPLVAGRIVCALPSSLIKQSRSREYTVDYHKVVAPVAAAWLGVTVAIIAGWMFSTGDFRPERIVQGITAYVILSVIALTYGYVRAKAYAELREQQRLKESQMQSRERADKLQQRKIIEQKLEQLIPLVPFMNWTRMAEESRVRVYQIIVDWPEARILLPHFSNPFRAGSQDNEVAFNALEDFVKQMHMTFLVNS